MTDFNTHTSPFSWCCDISIWAFRRACQIIQSSWMASALGSPRQHGIPLIHVMPSIWILSRIAWHNFLWNFLCRLLCSLQWVAMDLILDTGYGILMMWYENNTDCSISVVTETRFMLCSWHVAIIQEEKAKAKDLHPKLLAGMFFFFAAGATGGVTALLTSDKPIFERYFQKSCFFIRFPFYI